MSRPFLNRGDIDAPYTRGFAVTPHDTNPLTRTTRGVLVGSIGGGATMTARFEDDAADVAFAGLLSGHVYRFRLTHIRNTGTLASSVVGLD